MATLSDGSRIVVRRRRTGSVGTVSHTEFYDGEVDIARRWRFDSRGRLVVQSHRSPEQSIDPYVATYRYVGDFLVFEKIERPCGCGTDHGYRARYSYDADGRVVAVRFRSDDFDENRTYHYDGERLVEITVDEDLDGAPDSRCAVSCTAPFNDCRCTS